MVAQQQQRVEYKEDIIERLGGQNSFDLTIVGLAQAIQSDPALKDYYSSYLFEDLIRHQKHFLTSVFAKQGNPEKLNSSILLRHYGLIQKGFNEHHFDLVVIHFVQELQDSWVNTAAIRDAVTLINTVRPLFESPSGSNRSEDKSLRTQKNKRTSCPSSSNDSRAAKSLKEAERRFSSSAEFLLEMLGGGKTQKKSLCREVEKSQRGSSGEFVLNMLRGQGAKRTKQETQ
mmetsp:Transcript_63304/g.95542  ORF Transcript_63304/g.95542 Transcript_63304/m.95542 type:complete len:230 (+) Transcript_63304:64-753(+)|eukprot:CAMPEP_0117049970 /NCGR_PEP_ID=MMETSP0472-20121206/34497_1 /TAXON_ID=693140 ORGANISM="Tiarina fusus, Strain LIS" /NCGR_SAMPLE_ID=MMETSP0472 /ASSEMBLY_ACC=CAM_ASM_000603 /LENGTH=229 /DNA_ID=CAMNT_0004763565 /DNA_START=61 /DNA_END=753 /DNA_ORIENTATION=+